tara:strand:- start:126414 stop:128072 length:1659 start_codon:yes stop_codon:yes gene_type:complete
VSATRLFAAPLPIEQAYLFSAKMNQHSITVTWHVAPGYYLYRDRISFSATNLQLGKPDVPKGKTVTDDILGPHQILQNTVTITLPYKNHEPQETKLFVGYQGCASDGFCYPPVTKQVIVQVSTFGQQVVDVTTVDKPVIQTPQQQPDRITQLLTGHNILYTLLAFFAFGLLLTFTPCVLPMIPIISGIIVGQKNMTTAKAFRLSLTYIIAVALTYAVAGVMAGFLGGTIQSALQLPWVIVLFSLLFVVLSLSMFGLYELRLPASFENKLLNVSNHQSGGTYIGVFIMGVLSTLIVSPCISAPLVGVLAYIGQTGNAGFGGITLFMMGLGMGLPLLIIGTLGGKFLPKAGGWMDRVKQVCGFLLILVAIYMLGRILPDDITLGLYGLLSLAFAVYLFRYRWLSKCFALLFTVYAALACYGATMQHGNALNPLQKPIQHEALNFQHIKSYADLQKVLTEHPNKLIMLDFYADWCVSCKLMEQHVFADPEVQEKLKNVILLQADVTANDKMDKALEKKLGVYAPPTIIFFNDGTEVKRIVGETDKTTLISIIKTI